MRKKSIINALVDCLEAKIYFHQGQTYTYTKKNNCIDFYRDHFLFFVDGEEKPYLKFYREVRQLEIKK